MSAKQIIQEIDNLTLAEQTEVYNHILERLRRKEHILKVLERIKGVGKGVWGMDAQEYVTEMRSNDRC
jgi:predicted transposase YdaD